MPQSYITHAERHILTYLAAGKFEAEDRQLYHDYVTPRLISDLLQTHTPNKAINYLQYVIDRIDIRYNRAKDRRNRYELACYRSWLANAQAQIKAAYYPKPKEAPKSFMEAVASILKRQSQTPA